MKLYSYQQRGVEFIREHKYTLLGDEMGLGKTIQALAALAGDVRDVLVVCPAYLRGNWAREIEKAQSLEDFHYHANIVTKPEQFRNSFITIHICGYEMLYKLPKDFTFSHIIFDEAHYLKNVKAKRTQAALSLIDEAKPETCVLLSGTPIKNCIPEWYSLLRLLSMCPTPTNGLALKEKNQYSFNMKFTNPVSRTIFMRGGEPRDITTFGGIRNVKLLKQYFEGKYLRRLASTALELPPLTEKEINFAEKCRTDKDLLAAYLKYEESGIVSTLKAEMAAGKVKHTIKYILDIIEQGEPVVVFSDHVAPVEALGKLLDEKGIKRAAITGKTHPAVRENLVQEFQDGHFDVLVATIGSASTGYTMTRARNIVFNDYSWVPADLDQAKKRIHRIGQKSKCQIHYILGSYVDGMILKKIKQKQQILRSAI